MGRRRRPDVSEPRRHGLHPVSLADNELLYDRLIELIGKHNLWREAHVEVSIIEEAEALRQRDGRVRVVTWDRTVEQIEAALAYPHYGRIGVDNRIAAQAAGRIRAAGRRMHVTGRRFTETEFERIRALRPASVAVERYSERLRYLDLE